VGLVQVGQVNCEQNAGFHFVDPTPEEGAVWAQAARPFNLDPREGQTLLDRHPNTRRYLEMLRAVCVPEHTVGAHQFVYFDAENTKRCLAPDAFVTLGVRDHDFDSYLAWEEGTPAIAFEILSPSDTPERWSFEEKLDRYRALGCASS